MRKRTTDFRDSSPAVLVRLSPLIFALALVAEVMSTVKEVGGAISAGLESNRSDRGRFFED